MPTPRQFTDYFKGPYENAIAVTPSDSADLLDSNGHPFIASDLFLGVTGDVKVTLAGEGTVTFVAAAKGFLSTGAGVRITRVWSTGTTATNILACW